MATQKLLVTSSAYQSLGAGPMLLRPITAGGLLICSTTGASPANDDNSFVLDAEPLELETSETIWAKAVSVAVSLEVIKQDQAAAVSADTATPGRTAITGVDQKVLDANPARKMFEVVNDGGSQVFLLCGSSAASATNFTAILYAGDYYTPPINYRGEVRCFGVAAGGALQTTEY